MRAELFYAFFISFAVGILIETQFMLNEATIVWLLFLSFVLAAVWRRGDRESLVVLLASVTLLGAALGAARFLCAEQALDTASLFGREGESVTVEGVVVREPEMTNRTMQLYVDVGDTLVLVRTNRYATVSYGNRVRVEGALESPEPFTTDLGRSFNYPGYLRSKGVTHLISFAEVTVTAEGAGNFVVSELLAFKGVFMARLDEVIPEPEAGLASGLLLGVKGGLGDALETAFRTTGIIHIVVLSGYNVMLVITFVLYGLAFVLPYRARLIVGLLAISAFALLVGLSATVVRASIMAALLLAARLTGRTYTIIRALCLAGAAMLIVNPHLLVYDVGFQLSFIATLGLVLLAPWVESHFKRVPALFGVREFLTATVAVQLFVTPFLLYQIGEFSVVAVVVNVLVLPMVPVAMLLTFFTGVAGFVSLKLASVVGYITYVSLSYIIFVAEYFAQMPFASFVVPQFPFLIVIAAYAGIGFAAYRIVTAKKAGPPSAANNSSEGQFDASAWTIVEEKMLVARLGGKHNAAGAIAPAAEEVPVFFR